MKDVTGEKKIIPKTGVPGLKLYPGLSGSAGVFSGSVCKPLWLSLWCAICKYLCQQVSVCLDILGVAVCFYSFMNWVMCAWPNICFSLFIICNSYVAVGNLLSSILFFKKFYSVSSENEDNPRWQVLCSISNSCKQREFVREGYEMINTLRTRRRKDHGIGQWS